jgi:hypothetical protein
MSWYSYYVNSDGTWNTSKKFDNIEDFYNYAAKHPSACFVASTSEFEPLGRAYSGYIEEHNKFTGYKKEEVS